MPVGRNVGRFFNLSLVRRLIHINIVLDMEGFSGWERRKSGNKKSCTPSLHCKECVRNIVVNENNVRSDDCMVTTNDVHLGMKLNKMVKN